MADLNSMEFKSGQNFASDKNMMPLGFIHRHMTREERIKAKEREQAQKEGKIASDPSADGKEINPHVPQFIANAPWYMADDSGGKASLSHQKYLTSQGKLTSSRHGVAAYDRFGMDPSQWYARGQRAGPAATKYRKGACRNCGAMTHTAKECLERPRKLGAKYTGRDIQPDEIIRNFDQSFEGKRDRWNGYDNREYVKNMDEYERLEEARKALKEAKRKSDAAKADEDLSSDEDKYEYEPDTPGQGYDEKTRTSTRNLRIREDIAKYLLDSSSSSHYDPKSRSMRELPNGKQVTDDPKLATGKMEFHRPSGDAAEFEKLQRFAWQSERTGGDVHLQANPTEAEVRHKELVQESEKKRNAIRSSVLDKYGGSEHFAAPPKELLQSTDQFVEYTKFGEVIKGKEEPSTKWRYAEDGMIIPLTQLLTLVYINNHTSVYGSFFRNGKWGYACCHQFHKNSYCTGEAGIEADEASRRLAQGEIDGMPPPPPPAPAEKESSRNQGEDERKRDAINDRTKRKWPEGNGIQNEGRLMTAAESAMISEQEYEDYRRNKMARNDDPLFTMKKMQGAV